MQTFEIKRKIFEVIEKLGESSYKVKRKNDIYFLKDYTNKEKDFRTFVDNQQILKVCGVKTPKVYMYDKNLKLAVLDYIDGIFMDEYLSKQDLDETMLKEFFNTYWLAKIDKLYLDYRPENFKYYKDRLYYLPFAYTKYENNNKFVQKDIRYWFSTSELEEYIYSRGMEFDHSRIKSEYEINKFLALTTIKYFK